MKISNDVLKQIEHIKKISDHQLYIIINDRYLIIKDGFSYADVICSIYKDNLEDVYYSDNDLEKIYDDITKRMDKVFKYYLDMQDRIEDMYYPTESYYLLIINISKVYHLVDLGRFFIDQWFSYKSNTNREGFYIDSHLVDLDNVIRDDFVKIIYRILMEKKVSYDLLDSIELYDYEKYYLYGLLSVVEIIDGSNLVHVKSFVEYVDSTYKYLLKQYEKYQKDNQSKFKEENNDV